MKTVLIITYYWPPAGGPGVQRILKFAKYFPQFGWQPVILTVKDGEYPAIDESLESEIPKECLIYKTNKLEPGFFYKKFVGAKSNEKIPVAVLAEKNVSRKKKIANWIRLNLFVPDAKIGWKPFAISQGKKIMNEIKPDIIFSSSPPPTVHLIAKKLSKYSNIKWIADFRDPWTDIYYYNEIKKNRHIQNWDRFLELSVLQKADRLITVSQNLVDLFKNKKPGLEIDIIANGFDPVELPTRRKEKFKKFTIAYAGKLNNQQNPVNFWKSLQSLKNNHPDFAQNFQLLFMGNFSPVIYETIERYELTPYLNDLGYVPHKEALKNLDKSDVKLLIIPDTNKNKGIITGKFFEYLATRGFVLGIGAKEGDAAKILNETKNGQMFDYSDTLEHTIIDLYTKWKNGEVTIINNSTLEKYSRKNLTKELVDIFEEELVDS